MTAPKIYAADQHLFVTAYNRRRRRSGFFVKGIDNVYGWYYNLVKFKIPQTVETEKNQIVSF